MLPARVNRRTILKRRATEEMRVIIMTIQYVLNVERSTWECVDWGRTPATFMARKVTMPGIAPQIARTRTLSTRIEMQAVSYMRCKPISNALRSHQDD
ncbi:hypothetical protein TIFTF001_031815 [Ficus carica]|uniref:Uncharacterized protein n=1 Tax=Ficus carica TaxID=3494 RepID=A0AA88DVS8_FICCA|nr:hypothetical protein TIFTF001_031815 [Ficus carica]